MTNEHVRALNYSAHALEDLRTRRDSMDAQSPVSAQVLDNVIALLDQSVKFILPNCCSLIEPDQLTQNHVDMARLPFPCVAFETPWMTGEFVEHSVGGSPQKEVTKRIALCWELGQVPEPREGLNRWAEYYPQGGVFVYPIYWGPELLSWMPAIGGIFCPYEAVLRKSSPIPDEPIASQIANADAIKAGLAEADALRLSGEPFAMLPEYYQMAIDSTGSREAADANILLDARDEAFIQLQVCCMLACSNVATADVIASEKLNKKRTARGNHPFFSYKVLALTNERQPKSSPSGGTHTSPRMHLRRGHLRRLKDRVTWVRSSMINAESRQGMIIKDYEIPKE